MIDYVNALKTSWYISPPWGQTIPPVEVNLLERVYLKTTRTFGYCSGVQWKHECWLYTVICRDEIVHATEYQIIGTGELETLTVQKPAFVLGQKVILCSYGDETKQRSCSLSLIKKGLTGNGDGGMFYTFTSLSKNYCNITPRINFS